MGESKGIIEKHAEFDKRLWKGEVQFFFEHAFEF